VAQQRQGRVQLPDPGLSGGMVKHCKAECCMGDVEHSRVCHAEQRRSRALHCNVERREGVVPQSRAQARRLPSAAGHRDATHRCCVRHVYARYRRGTALLSIVVWSKGKAERSATRRWRSEAERGCKQRWGWVSHRTTTLRSAKAVHSYAPQGFAMAEAMFSTAQAGHRSVELGSATRRHCKVWPSRALAKRITVEHSGALYGRCGAARSAVSLRKGPAPSRTAKHRKAWCWRSCVRRCSAGYSPGIVWSCETSHCASQVGRSEAQASWGNAGHRQASRRLSSAQGRSARGMAALRLVMRRIGRASLGEAKLGAGLAMRSSVWLGSARQGRSTAPRGSARRSEGEAEHGEAQPGMARRSAVVRRPRTRSEAPAASCYARQG
jgi:hypothetical protein